MEIIERYTSAAMKLDDADYHSYNDTLWSWVKYLEEEYKEDEAEEDLEN